MQRTETQPQQPTPATQPWAPGTLARYVNQVGALIDIRRTGHTLRAHCNGCPWHASGDEHPTHERAQAHAETCRALPRPQ